MKNQACNDVVATRRLCAALFRRATSSLPAFALNVVFVAAPALAGDGQSASVAEFDPSWSTTVTTTARPASLDAYVMNVGAALPAPPAYRPAAGPRLTGKTHALEGVASYYWQGQMTATGEHFDPTKLTAAHKTLPFGTRVRVTRVDTGSSVVVRINDRGPFKPGRVIDLSKRAAEEIGMTGKGLSKVKLEVLGK